MNVIKFRDVYVEGRKTHVETFAGDHTASRGWLTLLSGTQYSEHGGVLQSPQEITVQISKADELDAFIDYLVQFRLELTPKPTGDHAVVNFGSFKLAINRDGKIEY